MSLSFAVLGSGSGGNSTVVLLHRHERPHAAPCEMPNGTRGPTVILVDAGLSPCATNRRLSEFGLSIADLSAILITHFDSDHFVPTWARVVEKLGLMVYVHHRHRRMAATMLGSVRQVNLFRDSFRIDGLAGEVHTTLAPHDEHGTVSFRFEHHGARFGFATDVGRFTRDMHCLLADIDGLAIESNYDPDMQLRSGRPAVLKRRIMGGLGHLSNAQSLDAVMEISCRSILQHVVALHLSRECNEPGLITAMYAREAPGMLNTLTVTSQFRSTPMLHVKPAARCVDDSVSLCQLRPGEQQVFF